MNMWFRMSTTLKMKKARIDDKDTQNSFAIFAASHDLSLGMTSKRLCACERTEEKECESVGLCV